MREMEGVAQQKLEGVATCREGQGGLRLAPAEMQMVFVVRDRLVQGRKRRVDQEMVVACVRLFDPGRRDAHLLKSEPNREGGRNVGAVHRRDDVRARAGWGGMTSPRRRSLRSSNCSVCGPGGSDSSTSVWPAPKCRWFSSFGIGLSSGGRSVSIRR